MTYNPELVKQLLGEKVAELFDGTIEIAPPNVEFSIHGLKVGDVYSFKFKNSDPNLVKQFIVTVGK